MSTHGAEQATYQSDIGRGLCEHDGDGSEGCDEESLDHC